jgi:hypothetical protein
VPKQYDIDSVLVLVDLDYEDESPTSALPGLLGQVDVASRRDVVLG